MGKNARIKELEDRIAELHKRSTLHAEALDYIRSLAQLPEDAVLLYTMTGNRVSHEIGKSARLLLTRLEKEQ